MCSSEMMTAKLAPQRDRILEKFSPAGGHMSPQSCQGMRNAYSDFKKAADDYIKQCQGLHRQAIQACQNEDLETGDIDALVTGIRSTRQAQSEVPVLKMYLPAMDSLNRRLDDCLRETRGKAIPDTAQDLGDADTRGQVPKFKTVQSSQPGDSSSREAGFSGQAGAQSLVQAPVISAKENTKLRQDQTTVNSSALCSDPALAGASFCKGTSVLDSQISQSPSAHVAIPLGASDLAKKAQEDRFKNSRNGRNTQRNFGPVRAIASERIALGGRHSNLFRQVRRQYHNQISQLIDER